eukprot:5768570-Alexandrium_andersonii.AAC.1
MLPVIISDLTEAVVRYLVRAIVPGQRVTLLLEGVDRLTRRSAMGEHGAVSYTHLRAHETSAHL